MARQVAQERRHRILAAARAVFIEHGFHGASMDEIAARARVSKPTVYKNYGNKNELFSAIVDDAAHEILAPLEGVELESTTDPAATLTALGRRYAAVLLSPAMLDFHRLALSEAARFPGLGQTYYDVGPRAVEKGIQAYLKKLSAAGSLNVDDAELAAQHFWALVLGPPRQLLLFGARDLTAADIDAYVDSGVRVFLDHYGVQGATASG